MHNISKTAEGTTIEVDCLNVENPLPESLISFELVFIVHFGRLGTRAEIKPTQVTSTVDLADPDSYTEYSGVSAGKEKSNSVTLSPQEPFTSVAELTPVGRKNN